MKLSSLGPVAAASFVLLVVFGTGSSACRQRAPSEEPAADTVTGALIGGTFCNVGAECTLTMPFASGIDPNELAVVGRTGVRVGSGSQVVGLAGRFGALISESGEVRVEAGSHVGSIWTKGKAFVGGGSIVDGSFFASSQSEVQAGAVVPPRRDAAGSLASMKWTVRFPAASSGDVNREPDRPPLTLTPGRYGALRIASRSTVNLSTGTYYFESYQLEPQATLQINNQAGTAVIYVRGQLVHRGKVKSAGLASDVIVGSFSTDRIDLGDEFDATLVAPQGQVVLARPPSGAHDGSFFAASVELQGGTRVNAAGTSNSGPAVTGIQPTFTPAAGAPLPGPVPSPAGKTYAEWVAQKNAFLNQLVASNYAGPRVDIPVHPDAARANQPGDFAVPSNASVGIAPAPAIAPRAPGFPSADAVRDFRQDMAAAETQIDQTYPFLAAPDSTETGVYGTPTQDLAQVPPTCIFTQQTSSPPTEDSSGNPIVSLNNFVIQPLIPDVVFGNKPDYLEFNQGNTDYEVDESKLPLFDGYWFFLGRLTGGWNGLGMEGFVEAGTQVGAVILRHHNEIIKVFASAEAATLHRVKEEDEQRHHGRLKCDFAAPLAKTTVETKLLGMKVNDLSWPGPEEENEAIPEVERCKPKNALLKLKRNLIDQTIKIFGDTPPTFPVGPVVLTINGAAEFKLPLAFNTDPTGPELTLAPLVRVYITVNVALGLASVEGEADVIRVDMPFKGKAKWVDHLSPETCFSSADFSLTYQTIWSTLNGAIFVNLKIANPISRYFGPKEIVIAREEVFHWEGLRFDSGEVNLLPTLTIPVIRRNPADCQTGAGSCADKAVADKVVTGFMNQNQLFTATVPYGQPDCQSQFVYEVPVQGTGAQEIWLSTLWSDLDIDTEAECADEKIFVDVFRQGADGAWERWDGYRILGTWQNGHCRTRFEGGGKQSPTEGSNTLIGFPWSWVDVSGGVQRVRAAVAGGTACEPRTLQLAVAKSFI